MRYPATSNYAAWQVAQAFWIAEKKGYQAPYVSQPMYNLLARGIEQEYVPMCKEFGVSMVVYNPLAGGLLTGKQNRERPLPARGSTTTRCIWTATGIRRTSMRWTSCRRSREQAGRSLIDLSLNWLLHHTAADCVILGASKMEQLEQNLEASEGARCAPETVAACDRVWQKLRGRHAEIQPVRLLTQTCARLNAGMSKRGGRGACPQGSELEAQDDLAGSRRGVGVVLAVAGDLGVVDESEAARQQAVGARGRGRRIAGAGVRERFQPVEDVEELRAETDARAIVDREASCRCSWIPRDGAGRGNRCSRRWRFPRRPAAGPPRRRGSESSPASDRCSRSSDPSGTAAGRNAELPRRLAGQIGAEAVVGAGRAEQLAAGILQHGADGPIGQHACVSGCCAVNPCAGTGS